MMPLQGGTRTATGAPLCCVMQPRDAASRPLQGRAHAACNAALRLHLPPLPPQVAATGLPMDSKKSMNSSSALCVSCARAFPGYMS